LAEAELRDRDVSSLETCKSCGTPLQEAICGYRKVDGGAHCSDCYFSQLSALIDEYPIGRPMATPLSAS
jgi:hypothetical protein